MDDFVIEADGVGHTYDGGIRALQDLSFRARRAETLGVVGASAAGKSTLLSLIAGIRAPTVGRLAVGGTESARNTLSRLRRTAGLVFQNPDDQLFMQTAAADVAFGPLNMGLDDVERRVQRALQAVGAGHLADRPPHVLSGGEKRAVSIAAILAMEPEILLLDEPSSGLDPVLRRDLIRLIPALGCTTIVASHDLDLVLDVCDRVLVLEGGRLVAEGPARAILADADLLAAHRLELPLGLRSCPRCGHAKGRPPSAG